MGRGHGDKCTREDEISREKCDCGKGWIIKYEQECESDWKGDSVKYRTEITCTDKECEKMRMQRANDNNNKVLEYLRQHRDDFK